MNIQIMRPDRAELQTVCSTLLDDNGQVRVLSSSVIRSLPPNGLRLFLHERGIYGLPTTELVSFIQGRINGRKAIEIGSGTGLLGRALGIRMTDSHLQERPDIALHYALTGQPTIKYGSDVERLDAKAAIEKYRPDVVIGSWITQWSDQIGTGSFWGVDEEWLLDHVQTYLMYGGRQTHAAKRILTRPHLEWAEPWMCGRALDPVLYEWNVAR